MTRPKRDTWPDGTLEALGNPVLPSDAVGQRAKTLRLRRMAAAEDWGECKINAQQPDGSAYDIAGMVNAWLAYLEASGVVASKAVGQHEDDTGLRTDGRPTPGERAPRRSEKVRSMFAPEDVERLDQWAGQRGVSRSTAVALIVRERLAKDGF